MKPIIIYLCILKFVIKNQHLQIHKIILLKTLILYLTLVIKCTVIHNIMRYKDYNPKGLYLLPIMLSKI